MFGQDIFCVPKNATNTIYVEGIPVDATEREVSRKYLRPYLVQSFVSFLLLPALQTSLGHSRGSSRCDSSQERSTPTRKWSFALLTSRTISRRRSWLTRCRGTGSTRTTFGACSSATPTSRPRTLRYSLKPRVEQRRWLGTPRQIPLRRRRNRTWRPLKLSITLQILICPMARTRRLQRPSWMKRRMAHNTSITIPVRSSDPSHFDAPW